MGDTPKPQSTARLETIDEAVQALCGDVNLDLPTLPELVAQLIKLTTDVDCNISDVAPLIKLDQSLADHLLRIANSLRYNRGVNLSTVEQAVVRLGLLAVRDIVVMISCKCRVYVVPEFESHVRQSFRHSLATAAFGQEIARTCRVQSKEAFLIGLLHDIGRPILLRALADRVRTHGLVAAEIEVLQAASEYRIPIAVRLIESWGLSDSVTEAVQYQVSPLEAPACALQAASLNLAMELADGVLRPNATLRSADEPHPMLETLRLIPEQVSMIKDSNYKILEWVESAA